MIVGEDCDLAELGLAVEATASRQGRRAIVSIDGPGASGKSTLAEALRRQIDQSTVVQMDDFYLPQRSRRSANSQRFGNFDLRRLREQVLEPAVTNAAFAYQRYDWDCDGITEWVRVPPDVPILVEGVYSSSTDLRTYYSFHIFCFAPRAERLRRGLERDGEAAREQWELDWMPTEDRYIGREAPEKSADIALDSGQTGAGAELRSLSRRLGSSRLATSWSRLGAFRVNRR